MLKQLLRCVISVMFLGLLGCTLPTQLDGTPEVRTLSFDSIDQGPEPFGYGSTLPAIFVVAKNDEVGALEPAIKFPDTLKAQLQQLDYNRSFAVLAMHGGVQSGGYKIDVQRVTKVDDTVNIFAQFVTPGPKVTFGFESPHHLVSIAKLEAWARDIHFVLMKDNVPVASTDHFIP